MKTPLKDTHYLNINYNNKLNPRTYIVKTSITALELSSEKSITATSSRTAL